MFTRITAAIVSVERIVSTRALRSCKIMRYFAVGRNGDDQRERERDLELEIMTKPGVEIKRVAKK